jgi:hypothetical protein
MSIKKNRSTLSLVLIFLSIFSHAQSIIINPTGITPVQGGLNYPRTSYDEILALPNPTEGDIAYDSTFKCLRVYNGDHWICTFQNPDLNEASLAGLGSGGSVSGTASDHIYDVTTDSSGFVYITGGFINTAKFGSENVSSNGAYDVFLAKYSTSGELLWLKSFGSTSDDIAYKVKGGKHGSIYLFGQFAGNISFDGITKTCSGSSDLFIVKLDQNGQVKWVETVGGSGTERSKGMALDMDDNIFLGGTFESTCSFGLTSKTSAGSSDIFIAKIDSSGSFIWVETAGGSHLDEMSDLTLDHNQKVFVSGFYTSAASFGSVAVSSSQAQTAVIAKYDPSINDWPFVKECQNTGFALIESITVPLNGNIYAVGRHSDTLTMDSYKITAEGMNDLFLLKLWSNGQVSSLQKVSGDFNINNTARITHNYSSLYLSGTFQNFIDISEKRIFSPNTTDNGFITRLSFEGYPVWIKTASGSDSVISRGHFSDNNGNTFWVGDYWGDVKLGATVLPPIFSHDYDVFLARIAE